MEGRFLLTLAVLAAGLMEHWCAEGVIKNVELSRSIEELEAVYGKLKRTFLRLGNQDPYKLDIVFMMDKSRNVGWKGFDIVKRFVSDLLEYFPIFRAKTRIAVVSYSTILKLEFNFRKNLNKECVRKDIEKIRYIGGGTATGYTLEWINRRLIFNSEEGARSEAKKIIFLLTGGKSDRGIVPGIPANRLKRRGVIIFAMGVTERIPRSKLVSIASRPSHAFYLKSSAALNSVIRLLRRDISQNCRSGQTVFDQCGRRCRCDRGRLVDCCRLRREFTDLSSAERVRYINTVKTASTDSKYKQRYEDLITAHKTYFFSNIHEMDTFLPWHRWFIMVFENLLREIDCRVTVPYWDWSAVATMPLSSDLWNPGPHGFGGNGSGDPMCVRDGPFRAGVWSLVESAGGGCLTRNFTGRAPDALAVRSLIMENSFVTFEFLLRIQYHDVVHCVIGGIMCGTDSAAAPEFFLHHAFVDKIWWDWQRQSDARKFTPFFVRQTELMPATPFLPREFLDLNDQPGCVCAEYVDPNNALYRRIQGLSRTQTRRIPRLALPSIQDEIIKLFGYNQEDIQRLDRLKKDVSPERTLTQSEISGRDRLYGFRVVDLR